MLLTLSGDISLYPGPADDHHFPSLKEWDIFRIKGLLHLLHVNVNSIPLKIDELRYIAKFSNAVIIRITQSKVDNCILDPEIQIDNYQILRCGRNRKSGCFLC